MPQPGQHVHVQPNPAFLMFIKIYISVYSNDAFVDYAVVSLNMCLCIDRIAANYYTAVDLIQQLYTSTHDKYGCVCVYIYQ